MITGDLTMEIVPCPQGGWDIVVRIAATGTFFVRFYIPADYPARVVARDEASKGRQQ